MGKTAEQLEEERIAEEAEAQRTADAAAAAAAAAAATKPSGTFALELTPEQRQALLDGKPLTLSEEQYTGGVRTQLAAERRKATLAEKKLAEVNAAEEERQRKALEQQAKFKELYEAEKTKRETAEAARKGDALRAGFLLAAQSKGVVDPEGAFLLAKTLPAFANIAVNDDGTVSGIDEAVAALIEAKPYLVASQTTTTQQRQTVGTPSNPGVSTKPAPKTMAEAGDELERRMRAGV